MTTFLHAFALTLGLLLLLIAAAALWMAGLLAPATALMDRGRLNLGMLWFIGYFLVTCAAIAGVVAVVA